jgi:hypothetical protein
MRTEPSELLEARVAFCDLLHGRQLRMRAEYMLAGAIVLESSYGVPSGIVTEELDRAAHMEWIAMVTERGQVCWEHRINRRGSGEG